MDGKLNAVPEYGKLSGLTREERVVIINWLISKNFIFQTKGKYPVLHPTWEGKHYKEVLTKVMLEELKGCLLEDK